MAKIVPTWTNNICDWAKLHWYKWRKIEKDFSHLVSLTRQMVQILFILKRNTPVWP